MASSSCHNPTGLISTSMVIILSTILERTYLRIPTTLSVTTPTTDPPAIHDDTSLIPAETSTISPITSTIPPTAPTTHYTSSFIYTDSSDDDTPDTPPSPTHEIRPVEVVPPASQILPEPFGVRRRQVTIVSPGQPIPYGQPYRYHPNRPRVGSLPTHCLAMRQSVDYSLSNHFTSDDSSRDSPSDSSSETSSDSLLDALSDSSSGHSSSNHSSSALPSVPTPILGALSYIRTDLLPPHKRIRSLEPVTDLKVSSDDSSKSSVSRETRLRVDIDVKGSDEPYSEPDINLDVQ
nr:hypothetical protein [Tanacetum cinerariifolium]